MTTSDTIKIVVAIAFVGALGALAGASSPRMTRNGIRTRFKDEKLGGHAAKRARMSASMVSAYLKSGYPKTSMGVMDWISHNYKTDLTHRLYMMEEAFPFFGYRLDWDLDAVVQTR